MKKPHREYTTLVRRCICGLSLFLAIPCSVTLAQTITSSGLNTHVGAPATLPGGETVYDITGGTRPGNGPNLFHSFGDFNVPNNNIANFLNDSGLPTSNILGRVTGGNISNIFGSIETTGFGNANLFLMNPAGFLFGPNATVNVGGMVSFTSADSLRLADGVQFNAVPNVNADALLSTAPVAAFGFLGSNPGAITIDGSQLTVAEGAGISLVGGNMTVQAGTLTAPSGQINLVSVGRPSNPNVGGEVVVAGSGQGAGFTPIGFRSLGTINLSQGSTIDASESGVTNFNAGSVLIRGGQLIMDGASIKALNTGFESGTGGSGGIIEVTAEQVALSNHSTIDTRTQSFVEDFTLSPGRITFNVGTFSATDSAILSFEDTHVTRGGAVSIQGLQGSDTFAHSVSLTNTEVDTSACCAGPNAGPILLRADNIALNQSTLDAHAGDDLGGPITLVSRAGLDILNSSLLTTSVFGPGGLVDLQAGRSIDLTGTIVNTGGLFGGSITMAAPNISLSGSTLDVGGSQGGTISLMGTKTVSLTNGTVLSADGGDFEGGGLIQINGGGLFTSQQSTISARGLFGDNVSTIQVQAKTVNLTDTQLTTSIPHIQCFGCTPQFGGGSISVEAKNLTLTNSQILSTATDGQCFECTGGFDGGSLTVKANKMTLKNSQILSTADEGHGGTIDITSPVLHRDGGSVIDASSQSGTDGTVTINGVIQP